MAEQGYMMKPLEVFAIDGKMNRCTGSIPYTSLQWNRKYYECGDFLMTVPASIYDPAWRYIETDERPETGIIQKVQYTDDPTYGNDDTVTISGFFLESIMNRRTFLDETPEEVTRRYYVHPPEPPQTEASIRDVYKDATGKYWYVTPSGKTYGVTEGTPTDSDARTPGSEVKTDESGQAYIETGTGRVDVEKEVVYKSLNSYYYNDGSTTEVHQVYYTMDDEGVIQGTADLTHSIAFNDGFGTTYFKDGDRLCAATGVTTKEGDQYIVQKSEWRRGTDLGWVEYTETVAGPWQITDVEDVTTEQDNVMRCFGWARKLFQNQMLFVVPTIAGESKIIDPSFKLLGDMMYEELKTVGASFRVEYDFQNNQFTFRVWRGLDRTQGTNSPEAQAANFALAEAAVSAQSEWTGLPSGYTQLEYIESTGTQYIDTGVVPNGKMRVVCDFQLTKVNPGFAGVFGSRGDAASGYPGRFVLWSASDTWRDDYNDSNVEFGAADTNRHSVDKNANVTEFDEVSVATHAESSFSGNCSIYAFCANTGGSIAQNKTSMRMWSCKIYTGDTLERDYAPCRRDSDGEIGLFDKVSQTFFANAGTGDFLAGADIPSSDRILPAGYTQLAYIAGTGSQYLDTGMSAPTGFSADVDFTIDGSSSSLVGVFGSLLTGEPYARNYLCVQANNSAWDVGAYDFKTVPATITAGTRYHAAFCNVSGSIEVVINDQTVTDAEFATSAVRCSDSVYLFGLNYGSTPLPMTGKVYSAKFRPGVSGDWTVNLVPCKRDSDGAVGMYDIVSQQFRGNIGAGTFIAGPEVRINGELTYASNSATATGTTAPTEGFVGDSVIVAENGFYDPQRTFVSWNTSPTGDGTTYNPGEQYTLTGGDDVLYAQWAGIPDALSYLPNNDNASGATQPTQGNVGDVVIVSSCGFSVSGAAFSGWNTKPDGSGVPYQPGDSYTLTSGADVLYAQWIEIQPPSGKAPWAVFSDTWGTLYGYEAQRDDSNYRNTCHVLYEYDKPNSFDENGAPLPSKVDGYFEYTDDGPVWQPFFQGWQIDYQRMRGFSTVRLEDDYDDRETYIDLREDKPECDEEWSRELYPAEDYPEDSPPELPSGMKEKYDAFEASLLAQGRSKLENDYPIVTSLDTGDLRTDRYMVDYDLGDLVDMAVNRLGIVEEARIVGASEVHESGSSTIDIEIGEQAISITKKARLAT